ncbi:MAG: hypothetical protein R8L07_03645 [Alphaproteobacteria bacterium]|nr:hypothetical protein [Alphaproteobacteria bacterium]
MSDYTLGQLHEARTWVHVTYQCGREVYIDAALLVLKYWPITPLRNLRDKFVCKDCRAKVADVWILPMYDEHWRRLEYPGMEDDAPTRHCLNPLSAD